MVLAIETVVSYILDHLTVVIRDTNLVMCIFLWCDFIILLHRNNVGSAQIRLILVVLDYNQRYILLSLSALS